MAINVVFLRHAVLCQPKAFAEALEVDHLPLAQELDDVVHVRVVAEAEDVVVGHPGLLLWCNLKSTTFEPKIAKNGVSQIVSTMRSILRWRRSSVFFQRFGEGLRLAKDRMAEKNNVYFTNPSFDH